MQSLDLNQRQNKIEFSSETKLAPCKNITTTTPITDPTANVNSTAETVITPDFSNRLSPPRTDWLHNVCQSGVHLHNFSIKDAECHESLGSTLVDLRVISADSWDDSAEAIEQWLDAWVAVDIPRSRNIPTVESDPGDQVVPVLNQSRPHPDRAVPDQSQVELDQDPSRTQTQLSGLTLHGFGSSSA